MDEKKKLIKEPVVRDPIDPAELKLPAGMRYDCHMSGRCCMDFWEIPLDPISLARLNSLPLSNISPKFIDHRNFTEHSPVDPDCMALKRLEGRCVFLDGSHRCTIHANFGSPAKPQTCLDFPYRYTETPRGIYVGLSMACPSVRQNKGTPIEERREQLAENYRGSLSVRTITDPVALAPGVPIGYAAYEAIEQALMELLDFETLALEDRLIAGYALLQMIERALRELDEPPEKAGETAVKAMEVFRSQDFARLTTIARKASGSPRLHRALIGLIITYRAAFDSRPRGRMNRSLYLLYQYARHMGGLGAILMPPLQSRLRFADLRAVRADWTDPYFVYQIARFCHHALFRKDAIVASPLLNGFGYILVDVALIHWYARAYAVARGASRVERDDVDQAIGAIEKYYCLHTDFMRLFDMYPVLNTLVDRVLAKPFFAPTLLRPKGP